MKHLPIWSMTLLLLLASGARAQSDYAPKIGLFLSDGYIQNEGTPGSTVALGGFDLEGTLFFTSRFALGVDLFVYPDYLTSRVPVSGTEVFARGYWLGRGTRVRSETPGLVSYERDPVALFAEAGLASNNYFTGGESTGSGNPSGGFMSINVGLGMDLPVSQSFDFSAELGSTALSFAAADDRYRLSSLIVKLGLSYLW